MKLTNAFIKHPCRFIIGSLLIINILGWISYGLKFFEFSDLTLRDFLVWSDKKVEAWDKLVAAERYI